MTVEMSEEKDQSPQGGLHTYKAIKSPELLSFHQWYNFYGTIWSLLEPNLFLRA